MLWRTDKGQGMKVNHLDDLYTWKQIRKLQLVHDFNQHNGFLPIALFAPGEGYTSHFGGEDDYYEWRGKQTAYCAKRLWETVRRELAEIEQEALAFDIVEASECFNTIRFKRPDKVQEYCRSFMELARRYANNGSLKSAIGRAPARPYPWVPDKRYEEVIIGDDADSPPLMGYNIDSDKSIPEYAESDFPGWSAVEKYFIELTEDELAFVNGERIINKRPSPQDTELAKACSDLDVQKVSDLLKEGANPNATSEWPYCDTLMSNVLWATYDPDGKDPNLKDAYTIIDLLISHGYDIDFSPYESCTSLYESVNFDISFLKLFLEKGANPCAISWIGLYDTPRTPLDSAAIDLQVYGEEPDIKEKFEALDKAGSKFFSELVPDFYEALP